MADRHQTHRPGETRAGREADRRDDGRRRGSRFWGWQPQSFALDMQRNPSPNGWAYSAMLTGVVAILATPVPWGIGVVLGAPFALLALAFGIVGIRAAGRLGGIGGRASVGGTVLGALSLVAMLFGAGTVW